MTRPQLSGFPQLVREHQAAVRSFLRRICWNFGEADDLAQETFITAWQQLHRFKGDSTFRSWLCGIAWRKALASGRAHSRRLARETAAAREQEEIEHPGHEARLDLGTALASLSEAQRAVVALCWGSGFSHDEAAAALGLPVGTVKSHSIRARERLKVLLERQDGSV